MPPLATGLRKQLEKTVIEAREVAEKAAKAALEVLAVDREYSNGLADDARIHRNELRARQRALGEGNPRDGEKRLIEEVAYEQWHRMLFARFLAENGQLLESEHQVSVSLADVEELARDAGVDNWELAGRFAQRMLPEVFRADDPVLALPLARETRTQLEKLVADLPREVFLADDSLGWTYQFWQAKRKDEVNKSGVKIGADEISPVTQLFTEDYMVEFLLQNTLGAWWAGKLGPIVAVSEEAARAKAALRSHDGLEVEWTYLRFVQDGKTKSWTPAAGTFAGWPKHAREIRFLDPCMGSGHFAVFALPLLARLRMEEENLGAAAAVHATLRDNIYGLELDERCTQIAAFNLALTAWKLAGHQVLPALHLACSGLAPNATEKEWVALAGNNEKLQRGMERLYRLFKNAPVLGSLINPRAGEDDLLVAAFHELQPLLERALAQEAKSAKRDDLSAEALAKAEMAVTARGLAKAAEILADQFTLVATNVPYLGRKKQDKVLMEYCERVHPEAKADLATCFVECCLNFCAARCTTALVTPQNWLFLGNYIGMRVEIIRSKHINGVVRLGPKGFQTPMYDFNISLAILTNSNTSRTETFFGVDVAQQNSPQEKASHLISEECVALVQHDQLENPDTRISLEPVNRTTLLRKYANGWQGIASSDFSRFGKCFWELPTLAAGWRLQQSTVGETQLYGGREHVLFWEDGHGAMTEVCQEGATFRGMSAWGNVGVVISQMGALPATLYSGEIFDNNSSVITPERPTDTLAIWCYCESGDFGREVRKIDQALKVTNSSLSKVPFDLAHWQKVAAEKYPQGLPKPVSSDPTQWLFNGHPVGATPADAGLQVAVARLLGYQWPRQTGSSFPDCSALKADGLEKHADNDGIVCLCPVRGERAGAERLRTLLSAALGSYDEHTLIEATYSKAKSLENWLLDDFFAQHCALFHHRPFIWHIWDGLSDGFHALVNYHQLAASGGAGRKLLETLTYSYLGDWIRRQQDGLKRNEAGSEDRLIAAQALQIELVTILAGEPPYDIFVRWKPLHQLPIGWEPDVNDGVRMNIRPFLLANDVGRKDAGILRAKPNIKWDKDRGTEPERAKKDFPWFWSWDEETDDFPGAREFNGSRWNSCHYTPAAKRAARQAANRS